MEIIRRSKIYYCLRWFGLDTVLAVSSVHLVVMQDRWALGTALGLGIVTSFFYMVDRLGDVIWGREVITDRHIIYQRYPLRAWISLVGLGGVSFLFWCVLPLATQWPLVIAGGMFFCHLGFIYFDAYRYVKPITSALIFTVVMMAFGWPAVDIVLVGIIFFYTLFNLLVHLVIELGGHARLRYRYLLLIVLSVVVTWLAGYRHALFGVVFGVGLFLHWWQIRFHGQYWFEWGELFYALPFFLGYGLMK